MRRMLTKVLMRAGRALLLALAASVAGSAARAADAATSPTAAITAGGDQVFLYSYFLEPNGFDGLHLAWSEDLFHWTEIPGPHFLPTIGTTTNSAGYTNKVFRDAFLDLGPDGTFHLVWTDAWGGRNDIGYVQSKDLIHWEGERLLPVMASQPDVENCWAPKLFYDAKEKLWLISWGSTLRNNMFPRSPVPDTSRNHRIWYVTTRDFQKLSEPEVLFDPGYSSIDAVTLKDGDKYYIFFKDERANKAPANIVQPEYQNIRMTSSTTPYGPFTEFSQTITGKGEGKWLNEGPTAIKLGEYTYVFYDHYGLGRNYFGAVRSKDYKNWEDVSGNFQLPPKSKHGHIFPVPRASLKPLLDARKAAMEKK